jgi:hypothetical protein
MARVSQAQGRKARTGTTGQSDQIIDFKFRIEGVERNSEAFKAIKRDINARMRETMVRVGERELLPTMRQKAEFPWVASALKINKERSGVFVGTTLPKMGTMSARGRVTDRALGYIDFGGRWHSKGPKREGNRAIIGTLEAKATLIDQRVLDGVLKEFSSKGFDVSKRAI